MMMYVIYRHGDFFKENRRVMMGNDKEVRCHCNQYRLNNQGLRPFAEVYDLSDVDIIEVDTEEKANEVLEYLSKAQPGVAWFMACVKKRGLAGAGPVVVTEFTEKGALPK